MKGSISYPQSYALIPEEEMVYLGGGADSSNDVGNDISGPIGVFAILGFGAACIGLMIYSASENRIRREYENKFGISSRNADGTDTTDYLNYNKRTYNQNRNVAATKSLFTAGGLLLFAGLAFTLSDNFD